jgi:alkanesulfonate monooxygenase SsuD/methylene tetrahydromethanopterin reductase-like flavin-dependent oxidoreductase (luciferase family)
MHAKFGLSLSNRAVLFDWATLDDLIAAARQAEASGYFHGVWVGDNLLSKPRIEAIVTLSAIAAQTQHVRLGTICLASFPLREPLLLAIQWASLDVLSRGRTILAVCNGGGVQDGPQFAHELAVMGVASQERVGRVLEGIAILRRLWSEACVTHAGKYYQFAEVELLPKPVQQPVPIYLAVNPKAERVPAAVIDRILRRVARHADGWQTDATPVETFRQRFDTIRTYAASQGRNPAQLESCLHLMVNINNNREHAFEEAATFLSSYYGAGTVSRERAELWLAYGPPEAVIAKIQAYIDAGCTMPVLRFVSPDLPGQLQRCIEEVLPAFRQEAGNAPARYGPPPDQAGSGPATLSARKESAPR